MKRYVDLIAEDAPKESNPDPITPQQLNALEKHLDEIWGHLKIDFDFTKHFFERVNDPRNKKQITIRELQKIFVQVYTKYGAVIANKVKPETEKAFDTVLTDLKTKINSPVILVWNRDRRRLEMKAKTVMRVDHFYTHPDQPRLTVETNMKQKTYSDLKEWVGFNTPSVASATAVQAVDDVDTAAFSVEQSDVLDKLNAYCHEISNHQYINPYYALNTIWRKLSLIGLNFNLKAVMLVGNAGSIAVPLNRFGGRYGYLPHQHVVDGETNHPNLVHSDHGFDIPGGLNIVFTWVKTAGVYSLDAHIEHGSDVLPIGEAETEKKSS